jgi:transcriptional regulator with XRE-family HTH domain
MTPAEVRAVFARRVLRERRARDWSMRELAGKAGVSPATVHRAEMGHEVYLSVAVAVGGALGMTLAEMFSPPECGHCDGHPPAGFLCPECGRGGIG